MFPISHYYHSPEIHNLVKMWTLKNSKCRKNILPSQFGGRNLRHDTPSWGGDQSKFIVVYAMNFKELIRDYNNNNSLNIGTLK